MTRMNTMWIAMGYYVIPNRNKIQVNLKQKYLVGANERCIHSEDNRV